MWKPDRHKTVKLSRRQPHYVTSHAMMNDHHYYVLFVDTSISRLDHSAYVHDTPAEPFGYSSKLVSAACYCIRE